MRTFIFTLLSSTNSTLFLVGVAGVGVAGVGVASIIVASDGEIAFEFPSFSLSLIESVFSGKLLLKYPLSGRGLSNDGSALLPCSWLSRVGSVVFCPTVIVLVVVLFVVNPDS